MGFFDFLGNVFGMKSQENIARDQLAVQKGINEQNIAFQRETNAQNIAENRYLMERQIGAQEAAAKSAIQWRVADAASAGIHPLYAMGNPGISVGPVGVGASSVAPRAEMPQFAPSSTPDFIRGMGQSIDAAMGRMMSKRERVRAVMEANEARGRSIARDMLATENMALENDLLRARISQIAGPSTQVGPPAPSVVDHPSNSSTRVEVQPSRPTAGSVYEPSREAGSFSDYSLVRTNRGALAVMPSNDAKQRMEDLFIPQRMWEWRNLIEPLWNGGPPPPDPREFPNRPGYRWEWNPFGSEFVERPVNRWQGFGR